jgi:hypothetical protein
VARRELGDNAGETKWLHVTQKEGDRAAVDGSAAGMDRAERRGYRRVTLATLTGRTGAIALDRRSGFLATAPYRDIPVGRAIDLERRLRMETTAGGSLAGVVRDGLSAYFEHLGARIERLVRMLNHDQLWDNPFGFGNSVGRVVVHLTGSLNHYVGAVLGGTGYVRDRADEFTDPARPPADELLRAFRDTIGLVVRTIRSQGEAELSAAVEGCGEPVRDRFGLLLVCAAHVSNHVGQIVYLVQAHGHALDEKSW